MAVTRDQNEAIDFTDNDIRHLGNFPKFLRLRALMCGRNRISSIAPGLATTIPNLEILVLTRNALSELNDLDALKDLRRLHTLVCIENEVTKNQYYRFWLIWRCKSLRNLDFRRVKQVEREKVQELFGTVDDPTPLAAELLGIKSKTFDVAQGQGSLGLGRITEDERRKIKLAITNATTIAEIQRLEGLLNEGRIPDAV